MLRGGGHWKSNLVQLWQFTCHRYAHTSPRRRTVSELLDTRPPAEGSLSVAVAGFVRSVRKQKNVAFAAVGDGSTINHVQVVLSPDQARPLSNGSAVVVSGRWISSPGNKKQTNELVADEVEVQGQNDPANHPIQKKHHTAEFLRTLPHLRVRTPRNAAILQLRSQVIRDVTNFFAGRNYVQTHPPIITSSDCEGAGEVFTVEANPGLNSDPCSPGHEQFFGAQKYLTVSTQLHLEALAQSVGKVWTLSPTFRAERSDTPRHLSEFYMLEAELAFANDLAEIMDIVEELLQHVTSRLVQSKIGKDLLEHSGPGGFCSQDQLSKRWESLIKGPWPRLTYHEVCSRLKEAVSKGLVTFDSLPNGATNLQTEHEKYVAEKLIGGPVFITDYPKASKPFYMSPSDSTATESRVSSTVSCFDLLIPEICELAGGSMREHNLEPLEETMRQHGMIGHHQKSCVLDNEFELGPLNVASHADSGLDWYLDLRRYGSVPHGGFGLGFDRLLGFLAGIDNLRDVVAFPRHYKRCLA